MACCPRPGRRRRGAGEHLRLRLLGQEGLHRRGPRGGGCGAAGGGPAAGGGGRVPGRALRRDAGHGAARGRRRAGLRRLRRDRCSARRRTGRSSDRPASAAGPANAAAAVSGGASGCDRRCSFCAIPSFRGAFVSRPWADVLAEAHWLAEGGVRELVLVSENSTSYGKDLGDLRLLERLLPALAAVPGVARVRVSYLQPAEMRPSLIEVMAATPGVAPYFDLSFQHASPTVLRKMRRFGGTTDFLALLEVIRRLAPAAAVRSNVIVGFPGETRADVAELERFLTAAQLDAVGVFGYSAEDGTEAAGLAGRVGRATIGRRLARVSALVEELTAQRAEDRVGTVVEVLIEGVQAGARSW